MARKRQRRNKRSNTSSTGGSDTNLIDPVQQQHVEVAVQVQSPPTVEVPTQDNVNKNVGTQNELEQLKKIKKAPMKTPKPKPKKEAWTKKKGKVWRKRKSLFQKFGKGIKIDPESRYLITPENIAKWIAIRCQQQAPGGTVIDAFCGCGGNTIQFAKIYDKVIAIDINPKRVEMCKNNAAIYGVAHKIEFICGDFFQLAPSLKADIVFLSPPWGGLSYKDKKVYDLEEMDGTKIFTLAKQITRNVVFYLPRNINRAQVKHLAESEDDRELQNVSIEEYHKNGRCYVINAFFGQLAKKLF